MPGGGAGGGSDELAPTCGGWLLPTVPGWQAGRSRQEAGMNWDPAPEGTRPTGPAASRSRPAGAVPLLPAEPLPRREEPAGPDPSGPSPRPAAPALEPPPSGPDERAAPGGPGQIGRAHV